MKRKLIINHQRIQMMIAAVVISLTLSSCLKDTGPIQDFSQSPPVVSFQGNGQGSNSQSVAILASSTQNSPSVDSVELSLGTPSITLGSDVKVTITANQSALDTYNAANGTNYTMLPSSDYAIGNGGAITIPHGKNLANFAVQFFGSGIDFTQSYAVPLLISSASGGGSIVASNLNYFILIVTPANLYSGNYTAAGTRHLWVGGTVGTSAGSAAIGGTVTMSFVDDSTSEVQLADLTADAMNLTVHSNNSVTVGPATSGAPTFASLANYPAGGPSTYDPAAHVFTLNYQYINGAGNLRTINETLTLQ